MPTPLDNFHPLIAAWFLSKVGTPTELQAASWPKIAAGEHVLISAPTGSGKTLTAFLWALNQLLTGSWEGGRTRVLYVSPLKALNNDIERNLLGPLQDLQRVFEEAGETIASVRVRTRSGDTSPSQRQRMLRSPPEILITTPESLNILLASKGGRSMLDGLVTVILDEIHAVAGGKRGTHLITAVDRLVPLSGEFQRIALSATVRPMERVARFVGGYQLRDSGGEVAFTPRRVEIVVSNTRKEYDVQVVVPQPAREEPRSARSSTEVAESTVFQRAPDHLWEDLAASLKSRIRANRSTLVFANSRRTVEKITLLVNQDEKQELMYSHHGSLSREIRTVVESRLKAGELAAIAATNSLELGIDIGTLDEVLLVQSPPTVASMVQRIGRAGHRVGEVSRGRLYPIFGRDFLDAAVISQSVLQQEIEEIRPVRGALDVLAQVILSMVSTQDWDIEGLLNVLRSSYPYHSLAQRQFDLVLEMLAGRYADSRIRELEPRISVDRASGTVPARRGAARLVYQSGGTIPDRGYFHLRLKDSSAKLGELDEEFVWERSLGDTFNLGAQSWRIVQITHNDVFVAPSRRAAAMTPFWRADARDRSFHLSSRIGVFLQTAQELLSSPGGASRLAELLQSDYCMQPAAAAILIDLLERQRVSSGAELPHHQHLLVERFSDPTVESPKRQVVLHTFWGGRVNRPLALAMAAAWEERFKTPLQIANDNDSIIAALPKSYRMEDLLQLVQPENLERLLRCRLEQSGFFGARFRENAGRALLLPRSDPRRRIPLWLIRDRAKKLLDAVSAYEDFPILVETWRTCLQDEFEVDVLKGLLEQVERGEIRITEVSNATPSPFAAGLIRQHTNLLMYESDARDGGKPSRLSENLLREVAFSSQLRPDLPRELVDQWQRKLQRTHPGYAPRDADELVDWVRERVSIPLQEWRDLLQAVERDLLRSRDESASRESSMGVGSVSDLIQEAAARVVLVRLPAPIESTEPGTSNGTERAGGPELVCALESVSRLAGALGLKFGEIVVNSIAGGEFPGVLQEAPSPPPLAELLGEWLRYYGPITPLFVEETFGLSSAEVRNVLDTLVAEDLVVVDRFGPGSGIEVGFELCDVENLERLLRLLRASSRQSIDVQDAEKLPLFLASMQGLVAKGDDPGDLQEVLERLLVYPSRADLWESDFFPARLEPYYTGWLDGLMQESDLLWRGCGNGKALFVFPDDFRLIDVGSSRDLDPESRASGGVESGPPESAVEDPSEGRSGDQSSSRLPGHIGDLFADP
ncbi:MAG: DEAD/DEAH box helicase, partial [Thermoanaerobaculia bacterium]